MSDNQYEQQTDNSSTFCKVSELSQLSGVKKRALRRYERIGLLHPEIARGSGHHVYSREDLIRLERLAVMQMIGLSRSEIKVCLGSLDRELREELRLQRGILLEKRRRLNRAIYFMEYAEEVNRNPQSGDWHYLGKVIEAITSLRDPECFKRFYIYGTLQAGNAPRESTNLTLI
ncbi:MAG TPA: MerR family transcriptional regulator [Acidobacteriaceae bacterium]|nr:MerR family transcriptional regulator [Acidobacteriaceae bacterium]